MSKEEMKRKFETILWGATISDHQKEQLILLMSDYHHSQLAQVRERIEEEKRVMAHIVGAKRVETPWLPYETVLALLEEENG